MVNEAERFKEEDEKQRKKIESKNTLEHYIFTVKTTLEEENLKTKFTDDDKKTILSAVDEAKQWLDSHPDAETSDYESQQKKLEGKFNPIMMKIYQSGDARMPGGIPGGMPGGMHSSSAPTGADDLD